MAVVLILSADLMFGSRLLSSLGDGGHEAELIGDQDALRRRLAAGSDPAPEILVFDLTDDRLDGASALESLRAEDLIDSLRSVAFFSHVEMSVRERAQAAGFDLVVPRSRMAREAATVIGGLTTA